MIRFAPDISGSSGNIPGTKYPVIKQIKHSFLGIDVQKKS